MEPGQESAKPGDDAPIGSVIVSDLPARLDRLGWSPWHWRMITALGITWMLDGLENCLAANVADVLTKPDTLGLGIAQVGYASSAYLAGNVVGALLFGRLTDTFGRKRLFLVTLGVYLAGTALSGAAPSFAVFLVCRFIAGTGIGGEVAAMNSAIDELAPARVRGAVDLGINASAWFGVVLGSLLSLVLLNPTIVPRAIGWRLVFGLGAMLGIGVGFLRRYLPESPRWLLMRGRVREAREIVEAIERAAQRGSSAPAATTPAPEREVRVTGSVGLGYIARTLLRKHLRRSVLALTLLVAQSFCYNAIFFTYALILGRFYGVPSESVGLYIIPFAIGNFAGPLLLGRLFDTLGRRIMITSTFALAGVCLAITGALFHAGVLDATTQAVCWSVTFFVASAAASSAYLTVGELFPVELRGMAIAIFFTLGQGASVVAPTIFAAIVASKSRGALFVGYLFAGALMVLAAVVAAVLGVKAERKSLEELAES